MPTLTPSYLPPPANTAFLSPACASSNGKNTSAATPTSPEQDPVTQRLDLPLVRKRTLKIPFIELETPAIQEDMAASLAVALLGHVLFLKSQVPLYAATLLVPHDLLSSQLFFSTSPVTQLARVPGGGSASRAAKKRSDMVNAFDELSSHLHTTFSALSTALARNPAHRDTDTVYLALVLGPTIGAAKARVVLALEGLEVKIWGTREDIEGALFAAEGLREGDDGEDCGSDGGSEAGDDSTEGSTEEATDSGVGTEEPPTSPPASEPPLSRSPSPLLEESSQPSSPAPTSSIRRPLRPSLSPNSSQSSSASRPYLAPKPARSHAEGQQALRAAERLLARTLLSAYAEGGGMAAELGTRRQSKPR